MAATAFALTICGTTFAAATFGLLTAYLGRTFGWTQAAMSPGLSIFLISATAAVPVVGRLSDRFGSRRVALFGVISMALSIALGALMTPSILSLYGFYVMVGLTGAFTNPVAYMRAISLWFDRKRGLAIGLAVAGQGLGGTLLPLVMQGLAAGYGWRIALVAISAFMILIIAPVVVIFVRDTPSECGEVADGATRGEAAPVVAAPLVGLTLAEALRKPIFWLILLALGLFGLTSYAMAGSLVYILTHAQGLSLSQVATLQAIGGLSLLIGRVIFGWFMDRFHAPLVGAFGVLLATAGTLMLLTVSGFGVLAVLRSAMLGASGGAETDLLTLLVGRYFGTKALAEIYSWHNVAFLVGAAAGPLLFGIGLASVGLAPSVIAVALLTLVGAGVLLILGPYPAFGPREPAHPEAVVLASA